MKRTMSALLVVTVLFACNVAYGFDPMGPPKAMLDQNQSGLRGEYVYGKMNIDAGGDVVEGIQINKIYVNLGHGIANNLEVFARFGVANAEVDETYPLGAETYSVGESDFGVSIGGGTRATLIAGDKLSFGVLAQISWAQIDDFDTDTTAALGPGSSIEFDMQLIELQIALGATWDMSEWVSIYGGPFLHIINGDIDAEIRAGGGTASLEADLDDDGVFGGYVGASVHLGPLKN